MAIRTPRQGWQWLKDRWEVESDARMVRLWVVFAVTGSTSAWVARPLLDTLGLGHLPILVRIPLRLILILPFYQVLLLTIGSLAGEYRFFLNFLKRLWHIKKGQ